MLQVRRSGAGVWRPGAWARLVLLAGGLRDALLVSDPGLLRLQLSLRGVFSVTLASVVAVAAGAFGGFSFIDCASGITLSLMAPFLCSQEPTRAQRQRTLLALLAPAVGANVFTAVVHGRGMAGDSLFLLLVFLCFLLAPRSSRGIGYGLVAIVTAYVGLYLNLPVAALPIQVASQVAAIPVTAFACFVLVPVNPAITLRRTLRAVQARAAGAIRHAETLPRDGAAALQRDLLRLNQLALAADDQAGLLDPATGEAVRARLVEVELWTARLVGLLDAAPPGAGRARGRLGLHARRIGRGRRYATTPGQFAPGTVLEALVGLGNAVHGLNEAARGRGGQVAAPVRRFVPGPLAWRMAVRATAAAGLAMAGGMALSPQRWFWAVITVYVVFLNARTRGDTILKGLQRLGGTVLGIGAGLVLATALAGDSRVETATLIVSVFGMYYFFLASYTIGIVFVTILLGILYGMLGASPETLLVLRLEETAVGAAAAIAVALFVLPERTRDQVRASGRAVLASLADAVRASGAGARVEALAAMRPVDRAVGDLRLALAPLMAGRSLLRRTPAERSASAVVECVHWTRMLAAAGSAVPEGEARAALQEDAARLAERLKALAEGAVAGSGVSASGVAASGVAASGATGCRALRSGEADAAGRALHGLNRAVDTLAERLETGAYEAFAFRG